MNLLITGGAGYLGSVLTRMMLSEGHSVTVLDSLLYGEGSLASVSEDERFTFVRGDVRDEGDVRKSMQGVEAVVHLAALVGDPVCSRWPDLARQVNREASLALLQTASEMGVDRFVFASTCSNYGRIPDTVAAVDETFELQPLSVYAETKVDVERAALSRPAEDMAVTVLRFATLYGISDRMRFDLTVNEFVRSMLIDRHLTVYGELFWRPYVHVRDAARAIAAVLGAPRDSVAGQVFNVGDSRENYRKKDLVEIIRERTGPSVVEFVSRAEDPRDYRVSFERIRERLGFRVGSRVRDGVAEVADALEAGKLQSERGPALSNVA